jgi:diguanylate cyclase (GGDEF)-like protein
VPAAAYSPTEHQRLAAVRRTGLLGTPAEERFDRITRLARRMFGVPMSAIDIVGEKLAWLKSVQGFDGFEGARCDSYCHHTVLGDDILIVRDAGTDPRVWDSGFARTWVFYAGVALRFEGERVGVLCIGDSKPGDLDAEGIAMLRDLAALAEQELQIARMSEVQHELARANEELEMKANVDVLTRTWNRRAILEIAEAERLRTKARTVAVLLVDLDHFKRVNDAYGHLAGDEVLRVIGGRLRASIRPTDAVGRFGGEEFLVVMTDVERDDMANIAERIRQSLAKAPIRFDNHVIELTCSVGCTLGGRTDSIDTLVGRADRALYRAKAAGRNRVESEPAAAA